MKLRPRTFRIQWDAHAWVGVIASLLLFVVFFAGAIAMFREAIGVWQDPALHVPRTSDRLAPLGDIVARVEAHTPLGEDGAIYFTSHPYTRFLAAYVSGPGHDDGTMLWLDPESAEIFEHRSALGDELYELHFLHQVPFGRELTGLAAVALLVVVITGLLVHLKDLRRQWWQYRPALRLRTAASDAHKMLGLFGLPFVLAIAWSGAVLGIGGVFALGIIAVDFDGDAQAFVDRREPSPARPERADEPAPMLPFDDVLARAHEAAASDRAPTYFDVQLVGDRNATVSAYFPARGFDEAPVVWVSATDARVLHVTPTQSSPSSTFERVLFGLHFGRYAGDLSRWCYAILGLAGAAVAVTGNLVWLQRRDPTRVHLGNRLLERATVGVCVGLVLATAIYFAANRAIPWDLAGRVATELRVFFWAWGAAAVAPFVAARIPARIVAGRMLQATALTFAGVLVHDVATTDVTLAGVLTVEVVLAAFATGAFVLSRALLRRAPVGDTALVPGPGPR